MVGCFDIGYSFGVGDVAMKSETLAPLPDISLVGISNPLGRGSVIDVRKQYVEVLRHWRREAVRQARRRELDIGWSSTFGCSRVQFEDDLADLVVSHPIEKCYIRVFSIGAAYLHLEFGRGLSDRFSEGLLRCFEYAAYGELVSSSLLGVARYQARLAAVAPNSRLTTLSRRPPVQLQEDATGYLETGLLSQFTYLILCVDDTDAAELDDLRRQWQLDGANQIDFEYHGILHFNWKVCLLEPRTLAGDPRWPSPSPWTPDEWIMRMLVCIEIAHVFSGACDAMTKLFVGELAEQVNGYIGYTSGREPQDLNRLRTLALCVVNLTRFSLVTIVDEDQAYFTAFEKWAQIRHAHQAITEACDVLYQVQYAEEQAGSAQRDKVLNGVLLVLTSLTLISVVSDAYSFLTDQKPLQVQQERLLIISPIIGGLILFVAVLLVWRKRGANRHRQRRSTSVGRALARLWSICRGGIAQ